MNTMAWIIPKTILWLGNLYWQVNLFYFFFYQFHDFFENIKFSKSLSQIKQYLFQNISTITRKNKPSFNAFEKLCR